MRFAAAIAAILFAGGIPHAEAATRVRGSGHELAFYVGSHSWHTSIVMPRSMIPAGVWPRGVAERTFARYAYLEIGWGDRKFYIARSPNVVMAIDAVFSPGPSVLHVVGLDPPLETALAWSGLVRVPCTKAEFARLCAALGGSFQHGADGDLAPVQSGLYGETSRFYPATGRYHLLNTCNTWTARMMRAGGLPADTSPVGTWSAGTIIDQARRLCSQRKSDDRPEVTGGRRSVVAAPIER